MAETQHLFRLEPFHVTSGLGHFNADRKNESITTTSLVFPDFPPIVDVEPPFTRCTDTHHTNLYVYSLINWPEGVTWTLGASADFFERDDSGRNEADIDREQVNPKFGFTWNPFPNTTLRAAIFRALKRSLISNQTLEPTQVAGFNQFFDDLGGTESWRYGIAVDQKFTTSLNGGMEFSRRELDVPFAGTSQIQETDWEEKLARAYVYWTPHPWLAASAEYEYERFERDPEFIGTDLFAKIKTHRLPFGINFFHASGFRAGLKATYVKQKGDFLDPLLLEITSKEDRFWVVDASLGFRLPKRRGLITIEARNLFNKTFKFQDTDLANLEGGQTFPANPLLSPERLIFGRITLAF